MRTEKLAHKQIEAQAQKRKAEERARREAEAQKQAVAERKRQEEARRAEPVAPPPKKPAEPAPPPPRDLLALAEQARARGDGAESLKLYRQAADQGNAEGQFRLGEIYASGHSVTQNNFQAYVWFSLASNSGHAAAAARRDQVAAALQPAETQQADRLVRERRRSAQR